MYYKSDEKLIKKIIRKIKVAYNLRNMLKLKQFLEVRVIKDKAIKKIYLIYNTYIKKIAKKFHLINKKCFYTLLLILKLWKYKKKAYSN